jgi:pimeloyl-ACP methyl ester carboxylesterase
MTEDGSQIFISYHRADLAVAERLRAHLVANGVTTWMDHYDIPAGAYWPDEIDRGLNHSQLVVGLLSPDAVASRNVKNEWDWAIQNNKQLILLMTRPCVIPHRYVSINFIDATTDDLSAALDEVMRVPGLIPRPPDVPMPRTRYARSGEVSIAYQEVGNGPIDLIWVPGYISHVEHFWKLPAMAAFIRRFASFSRLMLFDKRGTGMSDRTGRISTLEERMDDIRAVMDACKSERAVLMGISEGVPLSILFAATYPDRTQSLILYGGPATYVQQDDYPWQRPREEKRQEIDASEQTLYETWGTAEHARDDIRKWLAPSAQDDEELVQWFAELMRLGASPGAIIALDRMNLEVDVRHILPTIRVPTLVVNRVGDRDVSVKEARYLEAHIPGAILAEVPGVDHAPWVGDQDSLISAIERFLAARPDRVPAPERETVLATIVHLASDRMDPAALASAAVNGLERFRGRIVATSPTGIDAVFDGPARAIRYADAASAMASGSDSLRVGIQIGEMELGDRSVSGPPVDTAHRLAELAQPGQLLTTGIVRDLVAGSGIHFDPLPDDQLVNGADGQVVLVVNRDSLK